ncbi:MAG: hypothetical protein HRT87_02430 [Legionellales bacterium]|nr:hypothetical protein [Legionellales bacterium]
MDKNKTTAIDTIVERLSKKTIFGKVARKAVKLVSKSTINNLKMYSDIVYTIISDNGTEIVAHEKISKKNLFFSSIFIMGAWIK